MEQRSPSPEFPKSGIPRQDIIPYNPHFRERASRHTSRPSSTRRISWSREADRVREISPRSEPEPEPDKIFYPPPRKSNSFSEGYVDPEEKYPLTEKKKKKKKKVPVFEPKSKPARKLTPEPVFQPVYIPPTTVKKGIPSKPKPKKKNDQLIRQHRDQRYRAQKLEQQSRKSQIPTSNLRKVKSETNLNVLRSVPKETLMKKAETGKTKHFNPPRWRHVGDRNRRRQGDKHSRSFASDYYF
ncbi:hypothetical protein GCK72_026062 [Caenorhabditis remanei]|uniref:Uncharacterized protein n=1 Tax=Caenorhabditis remanei TaxID=31234 RepID=A0A6A5G4T9_CAERE|nr:hypothetical protein GCK72_026062 [Caenorhabditis remanei]KAF1749594.1 hypothetical protein GCK72_026062 [Caenorhabditis remanei]